MVDPGWLTNTYVGFHRVTRVNKQGFSSHAPADLRVWGWEKTRVHRVSEFPGQ